MLKPLKWIMFLSLLFCAYLLTNEYSGDSFLAFEWSEGSCRKNL